MVVSGFGSKLMAKTRKKWDGVFKLPELPYGFGDLEPFIDSGTMELHYNRHHAAYTDKFNAAVSEAGLTGKSAHALLKDASKYPAAIRNNGGGYLNHKLFWKMLAPASGKKPSAKLALALDKDFGSFEAFKDAFGSASKSVFGSGWAWLIMDNNAKLKVTATLNQDNPIMDVAPDQGIPILCLDVWEHAYYMKNQNRRVDYIDAFWNVVNWDFVSQRYDNLKKSRKA
jgi:Fe-Mn family superoxide dismutase